ncbi:type 1 glutamine amidotransferase domain-containing protein [Microbacterium imperiale]|uniref:Dimethylallyltransferase n=1 Tax=Microbacterium imperiale TaxID=33884 RepID=A0A9W6M2A0_9MICO|nr:type 1 glutamine amidotransferase domain-containing protein [Microbacterium imperiale]MBP2419976.1 putative intracellular protease/amidase [Microbacterium imperiale]MDS0198160.1 type 1 glutamine amidotransferase domain-containing protein [Microbacterium imperiale]BFE40318.1 type 1 glutamine amidotransferase domain-containing protein [Microbacterium imperiale]GLJ78706.1 dimethylallyltransferase [Microbacterium imperiale]
MSNILMVVTAATTLTLADGSAHSTGYWAEELVIAHRDLVRAGHTVTIATPGGRVPTVDPGSLSLEIVGDQGKVDSFRAYISSIAVELERPLALDTVTTTDYDAIVMPGGHGPMADLAFDANLGAILTQANSAGLLIAPFCHGPAGLLSAVNENGGLVFSGRRLTVFSDEEELTGGLGKNAPWLVASTLRDGGVIVEDADPWSEHVVRDGNLISGQNPQSSDALAQALIEALAA